MTRSGLWEETTPFRTWHGIAWAAALAVFALGGCLTPATAQVSVVCTASPLKYSKAVFDRRSADALQHWACVATNGGGAAASVSEAALQGWMMRQGVAARSSQSIRIGAAEIKRRGKWATAGRVLGYAGMITAALAAGDVIQIGSAWGAAAGFTALQLPTLGDMLARRDPDGAIFERLALESELALAPGESAEVAMFAVPLASPPAMIEGVLPGVVTVAAGRKPLADARGSGDALAWELLEAGFALPREAAGEVWAAAGRKPLADARGSGGVAWELAAAMVLEGGQ